MTLILASKSKSRRKLLEQAGLNFNTIAANIDENQIKNDMLERKHKVSEISVKLASEKALKISKDNITQYVIGADQILSCGGKLFSKAKNVDEARENLTFFRGKYHTLTTSISLVINEKIIWSYTIEPKLKMRNFSDEFLEDYLEKAKEALTASVGCYFIEDIGIQLFSEVNGDYNDILGLPLLPLLHKLRELKVLND